MDICAFKLNFLFKFLLLHKCNKLLDLFFIKKLLGYWLNPIR